MNTITRYSTRIASRNPFRIPPRISTHDSAEVLRISNVWRHVYHPRTSPPFPPTNQENSTSAVFLVMPGRPNATVKGDLVNFISLSNSVRADAHVVAHFPRAQ